MNKDNGRCSFVCTWEQGQGIPWFEDTWVQGQGLAFHCLTMGTRAGGSFVCTQEQGQDVPRFEGTLEQVQVSAFHWLIMGTIRRTMVTHRNQLFNFLRTLWRETSRSHHISKGWRSHKHTPWKHLELHHFKSPNRFSKGEL